MSRLAGKVVVVTGASRGIGRVTARELARAGATVVITARTAAPTGRSLGSLEEAAADVRGVGGTVRALPANLAEPADIERLARTVIEEFGGCDALVNNAAYMGMPAYATLDEITLKGWQAVVHVNLTAPILLAQAFVPGMRARGRGVIVNVTSGAGDFTRGAGHVRGFAYGATKAAANLMTQRWARDLAPDNIAAIILDPGFTASELVAARAQTMVAAEVQGEFTTAHMQPMDVPARAIAHLCGCEDPCAYAGTIVDAATLVAALNSGASTGVI